MLIFGSSTCLKKFILDLLTFPCLDGERSFLSVFIIVIIISFPVCLTLKLSLSGFDKWGILIHRIVYFCKTRNQDREQKDKEVIFMLSVHLNVLSK